MAESVRRRCSVKSCSSKFRKIHRKKLCWNLFFDKIASLRPVTFLKKRILCKCFAVNFWKFLRTPFLSNTSGGCFCNEFKYVLKFPYKFPSRSDLSKSVSDVNCFYLRIYFID